MRAKIAAHKLERDESYTTVETPINLASSISESTYPITIVDCITVWLGNLMHYDVDFKRASADLYESLKGDKDIIIVTNEAGLSLIAADAASRLYMKRLAELNKEIAAIADNVCLMVSGIEVWIKGEGLI
jgi:adenosylcobinamide kinase/adenosylcobinamide-phosphate guanylyltransferase